MDDMFKRHLLLLPLFVVDSNRLDVTIIGGGWMEGWREDKEQWFISLSGHCLFKGLFWMMFFCHI